MTKKVLAIFAYSLLGIYLLVHFVLGYKIQYQLNDSFFWNGLSFGIPFLLVLDVVLFFVFLFYAKKWTSVLIFLFLLFSAKWFRETIQFSISEKSNPENTILKILSYNVGAFKNEDTFINYNTIDTTILFSIDKLIEDENPDIICFQEFHQYTLDTIPLYKYFRLKHNYPFHFHKLRDSVTQQNALSGPVIFSKFPIEGVFYQDLNIPSAGMNRIVAVDVYLKTDTIRLFNAHFNSLSIRVHKSQTPEKQLETAISIFQKVKNSFTLHVNNVRVLDSLLQKSEKPTIICADLNSSPYSYPYQVLREKYNNTFEEKGNGLGFTLNRFPYFIRLDQIFVSEELHVLSHQTIKKENKTDHFPILVQLELRR